MAERYARLAAKEFKARNKARAVTARERSSLARGAAQAKRKVKYADGGEVKDRWAELPSSSNIEDRRGEEPLTAGQMITGNQAFMGHYPAPYTRAPRKKVTAQGLASGGGIKDDSSEPDPLDAELARRNIPGGLNATAGPTVTSTTPVQDIPAPKVNAEGETLPTYVLKEMGKQIVGTPERLTHVGGDLQRRGEYAGSHEDLPSFGPPPEEMPAGLETALGLYGFNAPFAKPGLGIFGGKGAKTTPSKSDAGLWIGALEVKVTQPPSPSARQPQAPLRPTAAKTARAEPGRIARPFGAFGLRQS